MLFGVTGEIVAREAPDEARHGGIRLSAPGILPSAHRDDVNLKSPQSPCLLSNQTHHPLEGRSVPSLLRARDRELLQGIQRREEIRDGARSTISYPKMTTKLLMRRRSVPSIMPVPLVMRRLQCPTMHHVSSIPRSAAIVLRHPPMRSPMDRSSGGRRRARRRRAPPAWSTRIRPIGTAQACRGNSPTVGGQRLSGRDRVLDSLRGGLLHRRGPLATTTSACRLLEFCLQKPPAARASRNLAMP